LKIYRQLMDIDTLGWNPTLKYDYVLQGHEEDNVRIIPFPRWQELPLPLPRKNADKPITILAHTLTVAQVGAGNEKKVLRLSAVNHQGKQGYYEYKFGDKKVDRKWRFTTKTNEKKKNQNAKENVMLFEISRSKSDSNTPNVVKLNNKQQQKVKNLKGESEKELQLSGKRYIDVILAREGKRDVAYLPSIQRPIDGEVKFFGLVNRVTGMETFQATLKDFGQRSLDARIVIYAKKRGHRRIRKKSNKEKQEKKVVLHLFKSKRVQHFLGYDNFLYELVWYGDDAGKIRSTVTQQQMEERAKNDPIVDAVWKRLMGKSTVLVVNVDISSEKEKVEISITSKHPMVHREKWYMTFVLEKDNIIF